LYSQKGPNYYRLMLISKNNRYSNYLLLEN